MVNRNSQMARMARMMGFAALNPSYVACIAVVLIATQPARADGIEDFYKDKKGKKAAKPGA